MDVQRILRLFGLLTIVLLAQLSASHPTVRAAQQAPRYPFRLRLSAQANIVRAGEQIPFTVEFLDRDYQPIANDRDRAISFTFTPITAGAAGEVRPNPLTANANSPARAFFRGAQPGKLRIRADSEGLSSHEIIVSVQPRSSNARPVFLNAVLVGAGHLLDFTVHAQDTPLEPPFYFCDKSAPPVPANGKSPITLVICLRDAPATRETVVIRTTPACQISYNHSQPVTGATTFPMDAGNPVSNEIALTSLDAKEVKVEAHIAESRELQDTTTVRFDPVRPASITLDLVPEQVSSEKATAYLTVRLVDEAGAPIRQLSGQHIIEITASDSPKLLRVTKSSLVLSPDHLIDESTVETNGFPDSKELALLALDKAADLAATKTIKFTGTLPGVALVLLLLFAAGGGVVGGVTRHVFRSHSTTFLPKHIHGRLKPGFIGNLPFSCLFGVILFLAIKFGIGVAGKLPLDNLSRPDSMVFACFFGVLGGFAGVLVLDRLLNRILPDRQPHRARAGAAHV